MEFFFANDLVCARGCQNSELLVAGNGAVPLMVSSFTGEGGIVTGEVGAAGGSVSGLLLFCAGGALALLLRSLEGTEELRARFPPPPGDFGVVAAAAAAVVVTAAESCAATDSFLGSLFLFSSLLLPLLEVLLALVFLGFSLNRRVSSLVVITLSGAGGGGDGGDGGGD